MTNEERIDELEIRYTFLEESLHVLNGAVIEKDKEIEMLRQRIFTLENSVDSMLDDSPHQKPPHY